MPVAVKFCGLTRAVDVEHAVRLGATFAGVILAEGPRLLDELLAGEVLAPTAGTGVCRVGVFGPQSPDAIAALARRLELDVVQLHGRLAPDDVRWIGAETGCEVWTVVRIAGSAIPDGIEELGAAAGGVVLDSRVEGALGGTGTTFDWDAVRGPIAALREARRLVLAGGLTPENVRQGVRALRPDVVDVSSGVEARTGVKDHARMTAFMRAALDDSNDP